MQNVHNLGCDLRKCRGVKILGASIASRIVNTFSACWLISLVLARVLGTG
jgi:hypothetical protein